MFVMRSFLLILVVVLWRGISRLKRQKMLFGIFDASARTYLQRSLEVDLAPSRISPFLLDCLWSIVIPPEQANA